MLPARPQRREVSEGWAAGLARLAGSARADRAIPVGKVHHLAERGAYRLAHVGTTSREDGVAVAGARERSDVETQPRRVARGCQRMLKRGGVDLPPGPSGHVGPEGPTQR